MGLQGLALTVSPREQSAGHLLFMCPLDPSHGVGPVRDRTSRGVVGQPEEGDPVVSAPAAVR